MPLGFMRDVNTVRNCFEIFFDTNAFCLYGFQQGGSQFNCRVNQRLLVIGQLREIILQAIIVFWILFRYFNTKYKELSYKRLKILISCIKVVRNINKKTYSYWTRVCRQSTRNDIYFSTPFLAIVG